MNELIDNGMDIMRMVVLKLLAVLGTTLVAADRVDAGFILQTATYNGQTYHLVAENSAQQRITWADAQAFAITLGGHLVTVNDAAENNFLLTTFQATALASLQSAHPTGFLSLWIGYNDAASEGNFLWAGGGGTGYTNWAPGEPAGNAVDEDYAAILVSFDSRHGKWHDALSDFRANDVTYGLVEVPAAPTPAPPSALLLVAGVVWLIGRKRA